MENIVTIILPLKGREDYTQRWLKYYTSTNTKFPVLVADGSPNKQEHLFKNKNNVFYHYYGHDTSNKKFMLKMLKATMEVKTPFVVMLDNDDFYSVHGIERACAFLLQNKNYSTARGSISGHTIAGKNINFNGELGNKPDIIGNTTIERISRLFASYFGGWHDLTYTRYLNIAFDLMVELEIESFLGDVIDCTFATFGNVHRGKFPYIIHQSNSPKVSNTKRGDFNEWINRKSWNKEFSNIINMQLNMLSSTTGISKKEALLVCKSNYMVSLRKHAHLINRKMKNINIDDGEVFKKIYDKFSNLNSIVAEEHEKVNNIIVPKFNDESLHQLKTSVRSIL